jgi:hypothetical protein
MKLKPIEARFFSESRPAEVRRSDKFFRRLEVALVLFLALVTVSGGVLPAWRSLNTDFSNYYVPAALVRRHVSLDRAYEWTWLQRQKDHLEAGPSLVGFVPFPPLSAAPFLPLASMPPLPAKRVWLALNVVFLGCALLLLRQTTTVCLRRSLLITLLCVVPLETNLLYGQFYLFILALISGAYCAHLRDRRFLSGVLLATAASLKLFPGAFLLVFLWKKDWRAAFGVVSGLLALLLLSLSLFGAGVHGVFVAEVLPRALQSDQNPYVTRSLGGIAMRLFMLEPVLNPAPLAYSPFLAAWGRGLVLTAMVAAFFLTVRRREGKPALEWACFVLLLLLSSTMPASYHYCVMIFSAIVGYDALQRMGKKRLSLVFVALFAASCLPGPVAKFRVATVLGAFLLLLSVSSFGDTSRRLRLIVLSGAGVFACVLSWAGFLRLTGQANSYPNRLPFRSSAFRADNPVATPDGIFFSGMYDRGYRATLLADGTATTLDTEDDVLGVAGSPNSRFKYLELAGRKSMIARLEEGSLRPALWFEGQQPKLSPNGEWLAFVREESGRGSAWVSSTQPGAAPRKVLPATLDVLEASVDDAGGVYAAVGPVNAPHLVVAGRGDGHVRMLGEITGPVRFPAVSPGAKWLAFARRRGGSWQLVVRSLENRTERELTSYPCNSTSPSWKNDSTLLYVTDCGRGLGLGVPAETAVP